MKREISVFDNASVIMKALKKGVLLTTKSENKVNSMVISWGSLSIEWNKELFIVYVRENRFTRSLLESNPEFTINIPLEKGLGKDIMKVCGTISGKDVNKFEILNLTPVESEVISVPGIKEVPLTLECKVIYKRLQDKNAISLELRDKFYPQDVDSSFHSANKDFHVAYYGEIVKAYIIE